MIPIRSNGMTGFPKVSEKVHTNWFPLDKATICIDASDYKVVNIATQMLADDLERIMTIRPAIALATSLTFYIYFCHVIDDFCLFLFATLR